MSQDDPSTLRCSIAGASGYSGAELVRLLHGHPHCQLVHTAAFSQSGQPLASVFPSLLGDSHPLIETDWHTLGKDSDVVFLALPHGLALEAVPILLEHGARVIDLGADFRLQNTNEYQRWYKTEHTCPALLEEAAYGLCEFERAAIETARLVANPGCYPTATLLALLPVLEHLADRTSGTVVVDAKSGVSGAGRKVDRGFLYSEVNENLKPYGTGAHRHGPEMEQSLRTAGHPRKLFFSPHLVPMTRGILSTSYLQVEGEIEEGLEAELLNVQRARYQDCPFIRVREDLPQTKGTLGSNFCDITVRADPRTGVVATIGAIDNLVKGAAGQAIQNLNLMHSLPETLGLEGVPVFP